MPASIPNIRWLPRVSASAIYTSSCPREPGLGPIDPFFGSRRFAKGKILTCNPLNEHCITSRMGGPWTHSHGQGWRVLFDSTFLRGTRNNPNLCVPTETCNNRYRHSLDQFPTDASQCEIPFPGLCCFQMTDRTVASVRLADRPLRCVPLAGVK